MRKFITKRRVLKWINEYRVGKGLKPLRKIPKGRPTNVFNCPIALACDGTVDGTGIHDKRYPFDSHDLPLFIRRFIDEIDEGKYPELELK